MDELKRMWSAVRGWLGLRSSVPRGPIGAKRIFLSGATGVTPFKIIVETESPGEVVHTAAPGVLDEVWLWAESGNATPVTLTLLFATEKPRVFILPPLEPYMILPGVALVDGNSIWAFASVADVVIYFGYVNRITHG